MSRLEAALVAPGWPLALVANPARGRHRRMRERRPPRSFLEPDMVGTFGNLALAAGRNPRWVMAQLGHADARLTLAIYAQVMQRRVTDPAVIWRLMQFAGEPSEGAAKFVPGC